MRDKFFAVLFALCAILFAPSGIARAERHYTVRQGQTLAAIAHSAGISIAALARANGIEEGDRLQIGQRLVVPPTRSSAAHKTPLDPRDAIEKLRTQRETVSSSTVRDERSAGDAPSRRAKGPATSRRHSQTRGSSRVVANFYRSATDQHARVPLLSPSGRVTPQAKRQLAALMRPRNSKKTKTPHTRLVTLLADLSKHFGGKPIHIISGYRRPGGFTRHTSRHTMGRAMDLRIPGVSVKTLRDYCRKYKDVGVGYYPRSGFVHLDVRDQNAFWVDVSGPGEAPRYRRSGSGQSADDGALEGTGVDTDPPAAGEAMDEDAVAARESGGEEDASADEYSLSRRASALLHRRIGAERARNAEKSEPSAAVQAAEPPPSAMLGAEAP